MYLLRPHDNGLSQVSDPRFFIFALPRSRTAWVSNLLSYESVMCLHEPLIGCRSIADLEGKLATTGSAISGCADTAIMAFVDEVIERYPNARFVVLARELNGFVKQMRRMGSADDHISAMLSDFTYAIDVLQALGPRTMILQPHHLDDYETCQRLWSHVGMPIPLNRVRFDMLRDMRVEVLMERLNQRVADNVDAIRELFEGRAA